MHIIYSDLEEDYSRETQSPCTDSLTGLLNHGFFLELLERELQRFRKKGIPFSLVMIDIDEFGRYNRHRGTVSGDLALKEVAEVIREGIRDTDLATRYLGDVFMLLLSSTDVRQAEVIAERIKTAISERFRRELTVCIGCASSKDAHDREGLIRKTKETLLSAKTKGRDSICIADARRRPEDEEQERVRLLVVEDGPRDAKLLEAMLSPLNCDVIKAADGEAALRAVARSDVDLILLDLMMPRMDGLEACRRLKNNDATRKIPVIMITALDDTESKVRAIDAGADDFITKPPNKAELMARVKALIRTKRLNDSLVSTESVLFSLANAVEAKDRYTDGHVKRVSLLAVDLGRMMDLPGREIEALRVGGILHDIGKIGVPDSVLNKPGPLDPSEWDMLKTHPDVGYRVAEPLKPILRGALDVIRYHHEKLDGSGYPNGMKGEEIPIVARVMAVVDIYDALTTDRAYRNAVAKEKALSMILLDADKGGLDKTIVSNLMTLISGSASGEPETEAWAEKKSL
jgi:putative two-component system response regulator